MLQPPSFVLRALLGSASLLTVPRAGAAWPGYISHMPDGDKIKDNALALYDLPGQKDGRLMKTGKVLFHNEIQVKCRCLDFQTGWSKMEAIATYLDSLHLKGIDAGNYLYLVQAASRSTVIPLGVEVGTSKRRYLFTLNVSLPMTEEYNADIGENDEFYDAQGALYTLVHVDFPVWFEGA